MRRPAIALGLLAALASPLRVDEPEPSGLRDGDRVVLVGGGLIERMQEFGYLETMLTAAEPDRSITFRNLGWSGDTVFGEARAGFGTPEDGFEALIDQVEAAEPTVLVVGYGANESWAGEAGLARFREGLDRLLDALEETGPREVVLLSPIPQEDLGPPRPDPAAHNADLALYRDAIAEEATERGHRFVDLLGALRDEADGTGRRLTTDGLQPNARGYRRIAEVIARGMGVEDADADDLDEELRRAIVEKNRLYFHRWRPQNTTYLFGFRKHEQGDNAAEVEQFDALVAEAEAEIARLIDDGEDDR